MRRITHWVWASRSEARTSASVRFLGQPDSTTADLDHVAESVIAKVLHEHVDALLISGLVTHALRREIGEFAIKQRLPSMVAQRSVITGGALMSYGPDPLENFRKAAAYVAKILNGPNRRTCRSSNLPR